MTTSTVNSLVSPSAIANSEVASLTKTLLDRDVYLGQLLTTVHTGSTIDWLGEIQTQAANWVRHSTLPTTRDEEWRFTDLSGLQQVKFTPAEDVKLNQVEAQIGTPETANSRLVFLNGRFAPQLSCVQNLPPGVLVTSLTKLPSEYTGKISACFAQAEGALEVFTALNTAGVQDGAVIYIPKNVIVDTPIHLVFIATGQPRTINLPRTLIIAETGAEMTLVEEFIPIDTDTYFTNSVSEIWLADNASINHTRIQTEAATAFHIGKTAVTQSRYSRYTCNAINIGGQLSRHHLEILQTGEQTETYLNGLSIAKDKQVNDTHSAIALNYPYGVSKQIQKNIIADRAHAIFNGKILVPRPAQLTDASQLNRNLLLSTKARVDTKPQLEITADNVKCAHGATVSQLEDDEIFYLQSRGINQDDSRRLLINAFAAEVIQQIPVKSLSEKLLIQAKQL